MTSAGRLPPLALLYGTRPQVIKASVLVEALAAEWDVLSVDTGQHYDYELNALLYSQLGVRTPRACLDVGSGEHAVQTAHVLTRAAEVLSAAAAAGARPRAAVVVGDTNSTLGAALAAAKLRIPVVHVEAGLRCGDLLMAEEINRRAVDAVSAVLCPPSASSEATLRREHAAGAVVRTGDVARDVLLRTLPRVRPAAEGDGWPLPPAAPFVFATLHRAELVDDPARLAGTLAALGGLGLPVVLAAHPRTRAALAAAGAEPPAGVHVVPPLGYFETLAAVRDAAAVVTDSGGVQREAYWLGTPCVTVRGETEWVETVALGANRLVAPVAAPDALAGAVAAQLAAGAGGWDRDALGYGDAAERVRRALAPLR